MMYKTSSRKRYEKAVKIIKSISKLDDVQVIYDWNGSTSFGMEHYINKTNEFDILFDNSSLEITDLIEDKHIVNFAVQLEPEIVSLDSPKWIYTVTESILRKHGVHIKPTKRQLEVYIILHEFGHAHDLYINNNRNLIKYLGNRDKEKQIEYQIKTGGYNKKDTWILHKSKPTEQYADAFASKMFIPTLKKLNLLNNRS